MSIQSVNPAGQNRLSDTAVKVGKTAGDEKAEKKGIETGEASVFEKSPVDAVKTQNYSRDTVKIDEIYKAVEDKLSAMKAVVEKLMSMQQVKVGEAAGLSYDEIMTKYDGKLKDFFSKLEVDDETRAKAQEDISENGFWGVKQTSERAIEFAKALCGGDPSKVGLMRSAIEEGYKAAEKAWGGELPEICRKTQEATLKGIDDWAKEAAAGNVAENVQAQAENAALAQK